MTEGKVWFEYLTTAHVQVGGLEVSETYLHGLHQMPRTQQVTAPGTTPAPMPRTFTREWATFVTGNDAETKGYDPGAYGIGVPVHTRTIYPNVSGANVVPAVAPVHLVYYCGVFGTTEKRQLLQVPSSAAGQTNPSVDLGSAGLEMFTDTMSRIVRTWEEYVARFAPQGFNRFGLVLPGNSSWSHASEMFSVTGDWLEEGTGALLTGTVYFEPMHINNERPLFDLIYVLSDITDLDSNVMNVPSRLLRWRGGIPSEAIAPINRAGDALMREGYLYDVANETMTTPQPHTITIDGQAFSNAHAYNKGYTRH